VAAAEAVVNAEVAAGLFDPLSGAFHGRPLPDLSVPAGGAAVSGTLGAVVRPLALAREYCAIAEAYPTGDFMCQVTSPSLS
jgi:hypothetical protein